MAQDLFHYDKMVETALRGVAREALARAARDGLPGDHHFYVSFRTAAPGVVLPPQLLAKFPEEMTIVLQHQFWGLEVGDEAFSVILEFWRQAGAADDPIRRDRRLLRSVGQIRPAIRNAGGIAGRGGADAGASRRPAARRDRRPAAAGRRNRHPRSVPQTLAPA